MGNQGDAYFVWLKTKGSLEELCQNKDNYTKIAKSDQITSEQFAQLQEKLTQYRTSINNIAPNRTYLGSTEQNKISTASASLEELTTILQSRYDNIAKFEPTIRQAIQHYSSITSPLAKDKYFCQIIAACEQYREIKHFKQELITTKTPPTQFYADLADLAPFATATQRKLYFERASNANSMPEFIQLNDEITQSNKNLQSQCTKIEGKYQSQNITPQHREFLKKNTSFYTLMMDQISSIISNYDEYTKYKEDLIGSTNMLHTKLDDIQTNNTQLTLNYVSSLSNPRFPSSQRFRDTLILQPLQMAYILTLDNVTKECTKRKKEVASLAIDSVQEMSRSLQDIIKHPTIESAPKIEQHTDQLKEIVDILSLIPEQITPSKVKEIKELHHKYAALLAYNQSVAISVTYSQERKAESKKSETNALQEPTRILPAVTPPSVNINPNNAHIDQIRPEIHSHTPLAQIQSQNSMTQSHSYNPLAYNPSIARHPKIDNPNQSIIAPSVDDTNTSPKPIIFDGSKNILTKQIAFECITKTSHPELRRLCEDIAGYKNQNLQLHNLQQPTIINLGDYNLSSLNAQDQEMLGVILSKANTR